MDKLLERFLQYVSLDTQSKPGVRQVPSTERQWKLLRLLQAQLEEMGLVKVTLSEKGTVMGTLPANVEGDIPAIGFISHVDTSPDFSGKNVNPQIVENYRGGDIALGIGDEVLSPVMFPVLHQLLGQTLITTDGENAARGGRQSRHCRNYDRAGDSAGEKYSSWRYPRGLHP
ncbi:Tripeptide aminopeptidase [Klebsiella pneumoniae]|nr:Tripeptide aminopeptidase [Klebsiella pneumoniae]